MPEADYKTISIRLPLDLAEALERAAALEGESQVVLIRRAVRSELKRVAVI